MDPNIRADLADSYGLDCRRVTPVSGGWLNKKWRVAGSKGAFLVKQFSRERFSPRQIEQIDAALQRQILLEREEIPCPHILPYKGRPIRFLDDGTAYMVMTFCSGEHRDRKSVTVEQMHSLGECCGILHNAFARLPVQGVKGFPLHGSRLLDGLWENFHACSGGLTASSSPDYKAAVLAQETILQTLTPSFFDSLPRGIAHEDFTPDNMLFKPAGVAAILDFDRNQYSYVWHDVGRALLSFTFRDNRLDKEKATAFLSGYAKYRKFAPPDAADALRITWCIETPWWIQPVCFSNSTPKTNRFRQEILWLTEHWSRLEEFLPA